MVHHARVIFLLELFLALILTFYSLFQRPSKMKICAENSVPSLSTVLLNDDGPRVPFISALEAFKSGEGHSGVTVGIFCF